MDISKNVSEAKSLAYKHKYKIAFLLVAVVIIVVIVVAVEAPKEKFSDGACVSDSDDSDSDDSDSDDSDLDDSDSDDEDPVIKNHNAVVSFRRAPRTESREVVRQQANEMIPFDLPEEGSLSQEAENALPGSRGSNRPTRGGPPLHGPLPKAQGGPVPLDNKRARLMDRVSEVSKGVEDHSRQPISFVGNTISEVEQPGAHRPDMQVEGFSNLHIESKVGNHPLYGKLMSEIGRLGRVNDELRTGPERKRKFNLLRKKNKLNNSIKKIKDKINDNLEKGRSEHEYNRALSDYINKL